MKSLTRIYLPILMSIALTSCGGGGGDSAPGGDQIVDNGVKSLDQAGYNPSAQAYQYGFNSIRNIPVDGAPADTDFSRWAMLHSGPNYHLYFFKQGSNSVLYQFIFDPGTMMYRYNFGGAINPINITDAPADADPSSIAMLHDGATYRLYMRGKANPMRMYQFGWNGRSYDYGHNSIPQINITGAPANADFSGWGMLHDGRRYRLYAFNPASPDTMYQFAFDGRTYAYGFDSINVLPVQNMPAGADKSDFAMLHDGATYRFYYRR